MKKTKRSLISLLLVIILILAACAPADTPTVENDEEVIQETEAPGDKDIEDAKEEADGEEATLDENDASEVDDVAETITEDANSEVEKKEDEEAPVEHRTYKFGTWAAGAELSELQDIIDTVNEESNGAFTHEIESYPSDYYIKLATKIAAKSSPDFFWLTQELIPRYAAMNAIADVTEHFQGSEIIAADTYYPGVLKSAEYQDSLYGVPWIANPLMVYINKTLFDDAGVDYPDPAGDWTWEEFLETAEKLTKDQTDSLGNTYRQYGYIVDGWPNIETFIWAGGGDIIGEDGEEILLDSPESLAGLTLLHDILMAEVTPRYQTVGSFGSNNVWFEKQRAAMFMGGIQDNFEKKIQDLPEEEQFEIGYAPMPVGADGTASAFDWTASTAIKKDLEGDKQAFVALEKLTEKFFEWKIAPPIEGTVETVSLIDPLKEDALPTIQHSLENARSAHYIPEWNEINDMLWLRLYNPLLSDPENFDYHQAAEEIAEKSREIIAKRR